MKVKIITNRESSAKFEEDIQRFLDEIGEAIIHSAEYSTAIPMGGNTLYSVMFIYTPVEIER